MTAAVLETPVGRLRLTAAGGALARVEWRPEAEPRAAPGGALAEAAAQLEAYFAGRLTRFSLPLAPAGTAFQRRVWAAMAAIPFGETRTYGALAAAVGGAARAVGGACGANPIPIIVPCHRVTAAGGKLGGWSGAPGAKRFLLALESARGAPANPRPNRRSDPKP